MSQPPVRLALIGLSASATTSWASHAHLPYLLSPRGREKYSIVALLNSSVEAARHSITHYNLSPATRAYGDPKDLAADADVQLVVCGTRVDKHASTVRASIEAGKDVFVEWPLAENARVAPDLASLAADKGVRTMIGLQGRMSPLVDKITEILRSGSIGKVVSSDVRAVGGTVSRHHLPTGLKYFTQKEIGGNIVTIGFAHLYDMVAHILGTVTNPKTNVQLRFPNVNIRDAAKNVVETVKSDVPDLVVLSGALPDSPLVRGGATLSVRFRRGDPFKGEPGLVWSIEGEKGELRLTSPSGPAIQAYAEPVIIEVHDYATDEVTTIPWLWPDWQEDLPVSSRNVGALYEAFAEGGDYPTFKDAVELHEQVDSLLY